MTINDEILTIANQLANQGSKPSVALVKTKLSRAVPLPTIISVLKTWQHDPNFIGQKHNDKTEQIITKHEQESDITQMITHAIEPLKNEIAELKQMIQILIDNKS